MSASAPLKCNSDTCTETKALDSNAAGWVDEAYLKIILPLCTRQFLFGEPKLRNKKSKLGSNKSNEFLQHWTAAQIICIGRR